MKTEQLEIHIRKKVRIYTKDRKDYLEGYLFRGDDKEGNFRNYTDWEGNGYHLCIPKKDKDTEVIVFKKSIIKKISIRF